MRDNSRNTETVKYCIDLLEVDGDLSLSIIGWGFSSHGCLSKSDISLYIGDEKIPFVLLELQRPDVVLDTKIAPLNCGFHLQAKSFINFAERKEKIVVRIRDAQKEFDNPYKKWKKTP